MMGGTCSAHRQDRRISSGRNQKNRGCFGSDGSSSEDSKSPKRLCSRHSVVSAVPDDFISDLYPLDDNYVLQDNGSRAPKALAELCTDTLCRSLPYLDGALPPGLPQDVVDDVVASLVKHSALNATTLRVLRNCELGSLTLAGCRGVTDEWLEPLSSSTASTACATPPLMPSPPLGPMAYKIDPSYSGDIVMEDMNLDGVCDGRYASAATMPHSSQEIFYPAKHESSSHNDSGEGESSCSTSSFKSAYSTHYASARLSSPKDEGKGMLKDDLDDDTKMPPSLILQPDLTNHFGVCITSNLTLLDLRGSQRLTDKGLMQLSDLPSLEIAKLDNCHSIQGRGLVVLARSHRLHTLSLANCRRLTDEAIINISHLISLEALSLDGCRCLTDRSAVAISNLTQMKKLDLSQCDLITDAGLEELEHLESIEELSLGWCRSITDLGIEILTGQNGRSKNLRILSLARVPITDTGVQHLAKLSVLEELDINGCSDIGSVSLGNVLAQLTKLTSLDVSYCPGILRSSWQGKIKSLKTLYVCYSAVRDSHLSRLTDLPALEELNFDSCPISDWSISHLADNNVVPNLVSLDLADTDLSDLGMKKISKFKKLKRLSLFYCNLSNSSLKHLSSLSDLEVLNLDSRDIGDTGLFHLRCLKNLKSLDIFSGRVTDYGCTHISQIKSLESLEVCGGVVTDNGCSILARLENLITLNLSQNERITNRGAAALAALSKLKALNLSHTQVNSGALHYFSDLKNLQSLALYGCRGMDNTNNERLDRLQSGLPNLKCVRLNSGSADDGIVATEYEDSDDDEDSDSDTEEMVFNAATGRRAQSRADFDLPDSGEDDSDNEMEDAEGEFQSDGDDEEEDGESVSSFSDHDV
eukprot:CAMPEP_0116094606 /NCGR_PEP_ID=MMETSP0327-20121206/9223_1 /TAXON_ID=44447 /ORGANISM="Pseudo-nitzschia delicatissima, Strain B596" /LENGTH=869 /DNA_ID=CAMNT_0003586225 /DNA_START=108 /DNA_END=2717 /DNA_ORIENTATION=-